ncbi:MAG: FkbM family methyltransferase [Mucilaginibacter sp.]
MYLNELICDEIDLKREGFAIEIGVGTANFYSLLYKELGFNTIAVDPIAYLPFLVLANEKGVIFDESCIYLTNGEQVIYTSALSDLSSLHNNWWGIDKNESKTIKSQDLETFLKKHKVENISFLKVDTEGSEYEILQQFTKLNTALLPKVVEFEYGGGGFKKNKEGGWSSAFFNKSLLTLDLLKKLGYEEALIFDSIDLEPIFFSFDDYEDFNNLFKPEFEYGNLIAFIAPLKDKKVIRAQILDFQNKLLREYIDNLKQENSQLYSELIRKDYPKRITNKIRRILKIK